MLMVFVSSYLHSLSVTWNSNFMQTQCTQKRVTFFKLTNIPPITLVKPSHRTKACLPYQ